MRRNKKKKNPGVLINNSVSCYVHIVKSNKHKNNIGFNEINLQIIRSEIELSFVSFTGFKFIITKQRHILEIVFIVIYIVHLHNEDNINIIFFHD